MQRATATAHRFDPPPLCRLASSPRAAADRSSSEVGSVCSASRMAHRSSKETDTRSIVPLMWTACRRLGCPASLQTPLPLPFPPPTMAQLTNAWDAYLDQLSKKPVQTKVRGEDGV